MGRPETHVIHDIFHVLQEDREYGLSGGTPETTTIINCTTSCAHRYIFQVRLFRVLIFMYQAKVTSRERDGGRIKECYEFLVE